LGGLETTYAVLLRLNTSEYAMEVAVFEGGAVWPEISGTRSLVPPTIICFGKLDALTFHTV